MTDDDDELLLKFEDRDKLIAGVEERQGKYGLVALWSDVTHKLLEQDYPVEKLIETLKYYVSDEDDA